MNNGDKVKVLNGVFSGHEGKIVEEELDFERYVVEFVNGHTEVYDLADLELIESSDDVGDDDEEEEETERDEIEGGEG
jgi:ribosomal protein L24